MRACNRGSEICIESCHFRGDDDVELCAHRLLPFTWLSIFTCSGVTEISTHLFSVTQVEELKGDLMTHIVLPLVEGGGVPCFRRHAAPAFAWPEGTSDARGSGIRGPCGTSPFMGLKF
jgi:hypothetical protein